MQITFLPNVFFPLGAMVHLKFNLLFSIYLYIKHFFFISLHVSQIIVTPYFEFLHLDLLSCSMLEPLSLHSFLAYPSATYHVIPSSLRYNVVRGCIVVNFNSLLFSLQKLIVYFSVSNKDNGTV